jgi:pyruvate/2-oxoglutarate/acetoin dehydrogenase E1 component
MLRFAVLADPNPVLFVEHKLLYAQMLALRPPPGFREPETEDAPYPTMVWRPEGAGADFTLVTYGGCAEIAEQAMEAVFQNREWLPEYVLVAQLAPLRPGPILRSVERTRRLVVVEEASKAAGFGAEVLASVAEAGIHARSRRVGARATPVPSSRDLEDAALPSQRDVVDAVSRVMEGG